MPSRLTFAILLALALSIRLAYVLFLPLGQSVRFRLEGLNDEPSHANYVHYLAEKKRFPVQTHHAREADSFVRNEFEYYQPPVYYVLGAGCELLFGKSRGVTVCRLLSFVFGVLSLLVIYRIFSLAGFPKTVGYAAVLFAAFFPVHAYFCSVVSNDALSWLFALLLTKEIVRVKIPHALQGTKQIWLSCLWIGTILGIGMLVKSSLFIFFPVVVALFLYRWHVSKNSQWLFSGAASVAFSCLLAAPWYVHNLHVYGSLFAFGVGSGPAQFFLFSPHRFMRFLSMTFTFFWFPMQHVPGSGAAGNILRCEALLLLVNIALCAPYVRSRGNISAWKLLLCLLAAVNIAAYLSFNLRWDNAEGRFFLPSLVPILLFFCVPVSHFCKRFRLGPAVLPLLCAEALFPYVNLLLVR
jgi:4-amino-4-deoxy-L-arabinose transferase-like glycosyltransferase